MNRIDYDYYKVYPSVDGVYHDKDKKIAMNIGQLQQAMDYVKNCDLYNGYMVIGRIEENDEDKIICRGNIQLTNGIQRTRKKN